MGSCPEMRGRPEPGGEPAEVGHQHCQVVAGCRSLGQNFKVTIFFVVQACSVEWVNICRLIVRND